MGSTAYYPEALINVMREGWGVVFVTWQCHSEPSILLWFVIIKEELTYAENVYIAFLSSKARGKKNCTLRQEWQIQGYLGVCGGRTGRFLGW